MKRFMITMAIVAASFSCLQAQNSNSSDNQSKIDVSTRVSRDIVPDEIYIDFTVSEKDNRGKVSVQDQEKKIVDAFNRMGINTKADLAINEMGSSLRARTFRKDQIVESKDYTLKVATADLAAKVISRLNDLDVAQVSIAKTAISRELEDKVKQELLTEAAQKAKANAEILAEAVGSKVGKAIYINNHYSFSSFGDARVMMSKSYSAMNIADEPVEEESIMLDVAKKNLSISVSCTFELK